MSSRALFIWAVVSAICFRGTTSQYYLYRNFLIESNLGDKNNPSLRNLEDGSDATGSDTEGSGAYDGAQLVKIHTRKLKRPEIGILMDDYEAEPWSINADGIDMLIKKDFLWESKAFLNETDMSYNVLIDDVQDKIKYSKMNKTETSIVRKKLKSQQVLSWDDYQEFDNINNYFFKLIRTYSNLCTILSIGRTTEGRELKVLKISNGRANNGVIFISGGAEGRDWISPPAITYFVEHLLTHWRNYTLNVRSFDWYILPMLNPDGYEYSRTTDRLWSKNRRKGRECDGVNLERNFGDNWGGPGSYGDPCSPFYRGPERFSEPETIALRNILQNLKNKLDAYISIGAYGQQILYPWGDSDDLPNDFRELLTLSSKAVVNIQKKTGKEYTTGSVYELSLPSAGNSCDWVKATLNTKYVFTMMLQDLGKYGYLLPANSIIESGEEVTQMALTVAQHILGSNGKFSNKQLNY